MTLDVVIKTAYILYFALLGLAAVLLFAGRATIAVVVALTVVATHWLLSGISVVIGESTVADRYNFRCLWRALAAVATDVAFTVATLILLWVAIKSPRSPRLAAFGIAVAFVANIGCVQLRFNTPERCDAG